MVFIWASNLCFACLIAWSYFFRLLVNASMLIMCLGTILQVLHFYRLREFSVIVGSRLGSVGYINDICGSWRMQFMFVARFYFFWPKYMRTWCSGKFPGHPGNRIMHTHAPHVYILPIFDVIICNCTHKHRSIPINTHLHPIYIKLNIVLVTYNNFFDFEKYRCKCVHVKHNISLNIDSPTTLGNPYTLLSHIRAINYQLLPEIINIYGPKCMLCFGDFNHTCNIMMTIAEDGIKKIKYLYS